MLRLRNLILFLLLILSVPSLAQQLGPGANEPRPRDAWSERREAARQTLERERFAARAQQEAGDKTAAARLAKLKKIALKDDFQDDPEVKRLQAKEKLAEPVSERAREQIWKGVPPHELDSTARKLVEDAVDEVLFDLAGASGKERARLQKRLAELLEIYKKKGSLAGENEVQALRLREKDKATRTLEHYRKEAKRLTTPVPNDDFDYDSSYEPRGVVRGSYITSADGRDDSPVGLSRTDTRGVRLETMSAFEGGWH